MFAQWSAECSPDDPVLVVPWQDPRTGAAFVDLRLNPYDFDHLPEAEQYPPLMQALRALNATRSPVFTAKCDAWTMSPEERQSLRIDLDFADPALDDPATDDSALDSGFATYIDILWRERAIFASFHQQEQQLHRLTRLAAPLDHPHAALEAIIRPAFVDLPGAPGSTLRAQTHEGFSVSLYLKALGPDPPSADRAWADALEATVALLRGRDFASA